MRPSAVCPGVFTDVMLQSGGATTRNRRLKYDWCSVQLEKFLMPILEEGPKSMLFQQDGGSALHFESSWIESYEDRDHQTQP